MLDTLPNLDELIIQIYDIRKLMVATGTTKGLGNIDTLRYSEELDKLIIQVQLKSRP